MRPADFGDSMTFYLKPPWGQSVHLFSKNVLTSPGWMKFGDIHGPQIILWLFLLIAANCGNTLRAVGVIFFTCSYSKSPEDKFQWLSSSFDKILDCLILQFINKYLQIPNYNGKLAFSFKYYCAFRVASIAVSFYTWIDKVEPVVSWHRCCRFASAMMEPLNTDWQAIVSANQICRFPAKP